MIGYGLDASRMTFIGYSNGANFLASVMQLRPSLISRAILLRAIQVLDAPQAEDLSEARVLLLGGRDDTSGRDPTALSDDLKKLGADVEARVLPVGHDLSGADVTEAAEWLGRNLSDP